MQNTCIKKRFYREMPQSQRQTDQWHCTDHAHGSNNTIAVKYSTLSTSAR